MRIALLAPLVSPIAPPFLGGAQAMLADLASGLAQRGHDVTLYAADGSNVPGVRVITFGVDSASLQPARFHAHGALRRKDEPLAPPDAEVFLPGYAFLRAYRAIAARANQHDLVHGHAYDWPAYIHPSLQPLPILHTLHLPALDPDINRALGIIAPANGPSSYAAFLVTVSQACAATYAPYCRIDEVIYNGVAMERIPFGQRADEPEYLLYAGRISPEKGVEDALAIAERAGKRLVLVGGVYDTSYFDRVVAPRLAALGDRAEYLGALDRERVWKLMAGASAVLCPAKWEEPFGLVACEALAAGAPVVGYARGGLREIVRDGETGWLVPPNEVEAAVAAVSRAGSLSRAACRASVERRFSLGAMLDSYEAFYARMLERRP